MNSRIGPTLWILLQAFGLFQPAVAANLCTNLAIETPEGAPLLRKYEVELKKAIYPQLKKLGWKGKPYISVQNLPSALYRIAPHYMIRIDLYPAKPGAAPVVLRNKTIQTSLRLDSYPHPDRKECELVLQARDDEYLVIPKTPDSYHVNTNDVPTKVYVPRITVRHRLRMRELESIQPVAATGALPESAPAPATLPVPAVYRSDRIK